MGTSKNKTFKQLIQEMETLMIEPRIVQKNI